MTHLELLTHFYQAYKMDDLEYAKILQAKFPEECEEVLTMILAAETAEEFQDLLKTLTK